jgi:hypothetical protein
MHVLIEDKEDLAFQIAIQSTKYIILDAYSYWSQPDQF